MSGKLLRSVLVVGVAASLAVLGASTALAGESLGRVERSQPRLLLHARTIQRAGAIAPGDRVERTLVLRNRAPGVLRALDLTVKASRRTLLTDRKLGLRLSLDRCSTRWTPTADGSSYGCRAKRSALLSRVPVLGRRRLAGLPLGLRGNVFLRVTLTLPDRGGNELQGLTSTLVYKFTGIARR